VVVGAVINGFSVSGRAFSGGMLDWLTPFTLFCGLGLTIAYALLGATWLVMKSENPLQDKMRHTSRTLLLALLIAIAVISLWTPLAQPAIAARWFTLPNLFPAAGSPAGCGDRRWLWRDLRNLIAMRCPLF
jgi:cytochrome d ubiquinol oxidase subunit II